MEVDQDEVVEDGFDEIWHFRLKQFLYKGIERNSYINKKLTFPWIFKDIACLNHFIEKRDIPTLLREAQHYENMSSCPEAVLYCVASVIVKNGRTDHHHARRPQPRETAFDAAHRICRLPENFFLFNKYLDEIDPDCGWGRARRKFVCHWYNNQDPFELAVKVTRVTSRFKWKHCDLIKLAHIVPINAGIAVVLTYLVKGFEACGLEFEKRGSPVEFKPVLDYLSAVHEVKHTLDVHVAARLIELHNLTIEHIPTPMLKNKEIWCALIPRIPLDELLRQLSRLYRTNLLKEKGAISKLLIERLSNENQSGNCEANPLETFAIMKHCAEITRLASSKTLTISNHNVEMPKSQVEDALLALQLTAIQNLQPTGKKILVCVDIRKTLEFTKIQGACNVSPSNVIDFLLMALVQTETSSLTATAFSMNGLQIVDVNSKMNFKDIQSRTRLITPGPVNLAAPVTWATDNNKHFDLFITVTDNQTQVSGIHPADALKKYQKDMKMNHSRMIICGLTSPEFCLAPENQNMLMMSGCDKNLLKVIRDFAKECF